MTQNELNEIIANHGRWLVNKGTGKRADLSHADLQNADLRNADLRNADLSYADLRNADLRNADLRNADLLYADLQNADLRNTNLRNANLRYTYRSAIILQVGPIGSRGDYMVYNASVDNIRCGCWNNYMGGTLEEFEARVEEVYPPEYKEASKFRNEYLAVIGYFKTVRETCLNTDTMHNGA